MPQGGARGQNLGHRIFIIFFVMESLVFEQQTLFRVDSLCDLKAQGLVPRDGARGQNLDLLKDFFFNFLLLIFFDGIICI